MRLNDGRALPNFVHQALMGQPITVYGTGKQTRSFCYVSDLIDGIYRLMMSDEHEPTNIGNPQEITILEFAERIRTILGVTTPIVFEPLPQDDPKQRCPDISKARRLLGLGARRSISKMACALRWNRSRSSLPKLRQVETEAHANIVFL